MGKTIEEIKRLAEGVKVIKRGKHPITGEEMWAVQPELKDIERQSCIWDNPQKDVQAIIKDHVGTFEAYHTFGHPSLFKPSLAEVIDCVPDELIGKFNAISVKYAGFDDDGRMHVSLVEAYMIEIVPCKN